MTDDAKEKFNSPTLIFLDSRMVVGRFCVEENFHFIVILLQFVILPLHSSTPLNRVRPSKRTRTVMNQTRVVWWKQIFLALLFTKTGHVENCSLCLSYPLPIMTVRLRYVYVPSHETTSCHIRHIHVESTVFIICIVCKRQRKQRCEYRSWLVRPSPPLASTKH